MKKKTVIVLGIMTGIWMLLIFFLSSQNGAETTNLSASYAERIAALFYHNPTELEIQNVHYAIRKIAHIGLFAVLGMLFSVLLNQIVLQKAIKCRRAFSCVIAMAFTAGCGFFDEWHKQFIEGRHFQLEEVALNIVSGVVGVGIVWIVYLMIDHKRRRK